MADAGVVIAAIGGGALVLSSATTSLLSYLAARAASKQVASSNGTRMAQTVENTAEDMQQLKSDFRYHVTVQHGRGPIRDKGSPDG